MINAASKADRSSRLRYPLLWSALCAGAGIGAAFAFGWEPEFWVLGFVAALALAWRWGARLAIGLAIFAAFGALQSISDARAYRSLRAVEDGGARFAEIVGDVGGEPTRAPGGGWNVPLRCEAIRYDQSQPWRAAHRSPRRVLRRFPPALGDRVRARARLAEPSPPRNPGAFDAAAMLRREGAFAALICDTFLDDDALRVLERGRAFRCGGWRRAPASGCAGRSRQVSKRARRWAAPSRRWRWASPPVRRRRSRRRSGRAGRCTSLRSAGCMSASSG
ncbi:MAG: DUF4131 domain-containing protein [Verrucomicrobiales bacterium]